MRPVTNGVFGLQQFAGDFFAATPSRRAATASRAWSSASASSGDLVGWAVALASLLVLRLMRSPWGRVLQSIREDEDATRSLGKYTFAYKLQSLALGGAIGALAGVMLAINQQAVNRTPSSPPSPSSPTPP
jgi:branched-chain amino acid transport system permease protein